MRAAGNAAIGQLRRLGGEDTFQPPWAIPDFTPGPAGVRIRINPSVNFPSILDGLKSGACPQIDEIRGSVEVKVEIRY